MPTRPARLCLVAGCGRPAKTRGRCARCSSKASRERTELRGPRVYDTALWKRLRSAVLALSPLCVDCKGEGRVEPATEVDHRIPIRDAPDLAFDASNLQPLCKRHHSEKTARENV